MKVQKEFILVTMSIGVRSLHVGLGLASSTNDGLAIASCMHPIPAKK